MKGLPNKWRIALYGFFVVLCMALIFVYSSQNAEDSTQTSSGIARFVFDFLQTIKIITTSDYNSAEFVVVHGAIRTAAHFSEYFIFGVFSFQLSRYSIARKPSEKVWMPFVFCSFYALTDEFHQYFIPGRAMQLVDWMVDSFGILCAILLLSWITGNIRVKKTIRAKQIDKE